MNLLETLWIRPWLRRIGIIALHTSLWAAGFVLALAIRFDGGGIEPEIAQRVPTALAVLIVTRIVVFYSMRQFHGLWQYAGIPELRSLVSATTIGTAGFAVIGLMVQSTRMPRSIYVGEWLTSLALIGGFRFLFRLLRERVSGPKIDGTRTLIIGAGDAGESLLRDVQRMREAKWSIVGFLDDDPRKAGALIRSVRVLGPADREALRRYVGMYDVKLVVLAMGSDSKRMREIVGYCRELNVPTKTLPSVSDRIEDMGFRNVREVAIEDLLQREAVKLDVGQVEAFLEGKTVLITGAGGSIGTELARQALRFNPAVVLLFDHDENALFHIERELRALHPAEKIKALMGDITDQGRVEWVFKHYQPNIVLHAAAHKHVPMMEGNPCEAVKNNVFGTIQIARAAHEHKAEAFVLISTDKAVNPTNVMGATKRIAEMVTQLRAQGSQTRFAAVRFGNVLGSAGSVVPIFREQIAKGGPVVVTHPDVTRYFMTIPEATQLVLQAGALGGTGEIFILDMGEPVKIVNLARDLIELSGLTPDVDIQIEFSGLRPGEKLFEELLHNAESFAKTPHPKIQVGRFRPVGRELLTRGLDSLEAAAHEPDALKVRTILAELVPEAKLAGVPRKSEPRGVALVDESKDRASGPLLVAVSG
ncbi:MAG TPA: nucleoside-diphosphate sugar epimerase/dehydratase [Polyangiaceae bacterium]|nr:nucleoside-diphosphate sugar epimerase/dehydratase [Polyangiaceae bacterium]